MRGRSIAIVSLDDLPPELRSELDPTSGPPVIGDTPRTNYNDPPYSGEWREEKDYIQSGTIQLPGGVTTTGVITVVRLQRAWPLVGFGVFPGTLPIGGGNTLSVFLFALVKGQRVAIAAQTVTGTAVGEAVGQVVQAGAPCEVGFIITLAAPGGSVSGIKVNLWGSLFR